MERIGWTVADMLFYFGKYWEDFFMDKIDAMLINLLQEKNLSQDEREDVLINALSLVRGENKWV